MSRLLISISGLLVSSAAALGAADDLGYSPDGGLVSFGEFDYVYDSASRLTEVWSNGAKVVENRYDAFGRRVIKRTPEATHTFVYDGWLLVVERVELGNGQFDQIDYWWGKDISGTLDGASGIGGLLYLRKNGCDVYVPLYDGHGNVVQYVDKQGLIVASYAYDAFGNTIRKDGVKADELKMRFSTKYHDDESGLYYFGRRFYSPRIARWISRDPAEEDGGANLYAFCGNDFVNKVDVMGERPFQTKKRWILANGAGDSEFHTYNCKEFNGKGNKEAYITHFKTISFSTLPEKYRLNFTYNLINQLGMDSDRNACWCLVLTPFQIYTREEGKGSVYQLRTKVKTLDKHKRCCEKPEVHVKAVEGKSIVIGPR